MLVTTYGRRPYLENCLHSLAAQERPPDEVVIVTRVGDEETRGYVNGLVQTYRGPIVFRPAEVTRPGVLAANAAGLPHVTGDVLCFIDDDAAARPDWLSRIERHFARSPELGALGGRDLNHTANGIDDEPASEVGRIRWYGRIIGNHHRRHPGVHPAEALKGCNMSFRRSLIRAFDEGIIGNAHYYEMDLCFAVRREGFRILYDGDLVVDHYIEAPRHLPGNASLTDPQRSFFIHHNRVYVMMKNLTGLRRAAFLVYTFVSDAVASALLWVSGRPEGRPDVVREMFRGKVRGLKRYRSWRAEAGVAAGKVIA